MFISRDIDGFLEKRVFGGKALIVYGPRQAGKTTSIEHFLARPEFASNVIRFDGEEPADCALLADAPTEKLKLLTGGKKIIFIDEAHKVPNIGLVLKRLWDHVRDVQTIATGSSSEELAEKTEEPMTGRKFEYTLLPPSFSELARADAPLNEVRALGRRLVYGSYPDVVTHPGDEVERIRMIGKGYLYKDILRHESIRKPELVDKILRALAFQIGQEVSYSEIAQLVGSDEKTVAKYIDIMEKAFIVFTRMSYARNLRNELKKSRKVFFRDLGMRNFVLGDWRPLDQRSDEEKGHLWENYFISERDKYLLRHEPETRSFFWRTQGGKEIDLVEESVLGLRAYEIKWSPKKAEKPLTRTFRNAYPDAACFGIAPDRYAEHLMG